MCHNQLISDAARDNKHSCGFLQIICIFKGYMLHVLLEEIKHIFLSSERI